MAPDFGRLFPKKKKKLKTKFKDQIGRYLNCGLWEIYNHLDHYGARFWPIIPSFRPRKLIPSASLVVPSFSADCHQLAAWCVRNDSESGHGYQN